MSYAIRNTMILLGALLIIYAAGFIYLKFFQEPVIEEHQAAAETLRADLNQKSETANLLPVVREQVREAEEFIENFDKTLFRNNDADRVYRFLSLINEMSRIEFDYTFVDSTLTDDYGIINSEINGFGSYAGVMNFVGGIEHSEPVQKIDAISVTPVGTAGEFGQVIFNFELASHYDRSGRFNPPQTPDLSTGEFSFSHNPFYPLIRQADPNTDNLPDVKNSRLVGVGGSRIYLSDQNGRMATLNINDRVYLGRLEQIHTREGRAVFRLNRGGIAETVTLEVER